jgi:hypothetical protein
MAQSSGNNPECRRWSQAAALVADDTKIAEQSFRAHQSLMVAAGRDGDFDTAMIEGWRAFGFCEGISSREAEILGNIAQILYETGRHAAALRGFAAVVARTTSPRILLGVLGGAATAAAALGERRVLDAAAERIERLTGNAWAFPTALALLDLSLAYTSVGAVALSDQYRARGREIAVANGFSDLVQLADNPRSRVRSEAAGAPRVHFGAEATRVISDIEVLEGPADLRIAA